MIDTVIFDIGKVLVDFCWKQHVHSFGYPKPIEEAVGFAVFQSGVWEEYDKGILSDEEIIKQMVEKCPKYEKEIREVSQNFEGCIRTYSYAENWIQTLNRQGINTYYLSNYGEKLRKDTAESLKAISYCKGGVFSYEVKLIKPDVAIYQTLVDTYNLVPEKCIFIDDVAANVEAARKIGMHGILFCGYEEACKELAVLL